MELFDNIFKFFHGFFALCQNIVAFCRFADRIA